MHKGRRNLTTDLETAQPHPQRGSPQASALALLTAAFQARSHALPSLKPARPAVTRSLPCLTVSPEGSGPSQAWSCPGWGYAPSSGGGRGLVLEVRQVNALYRPQKRPGSRPTSRRPDLCIRRRHPQPQVSPLEGSGSSLGVRWSLSLYPAGSGLQGPTHSTANSFLLLPDSRSCPSPHLQVLNNSLPPQQRASKAPCRRRRARLQRCGTHPQHLIWSITHERCRDTPAFPRLSPLSGPTHQNQIYNPVEEQREGCADTKTISLRRPSPH